MIDLDEAARVATLEGDRRMFSWMRFASFVLLAGSLSACRPAQTPSEHCYRMNVVKRMGRSTQPNPTLDELEERRCDAMAAEERREAREDAARPEERQEREDARREILAAIKESQSTRAGEPGEASVAAPATRPGGSLAGLWLGDFGGGRLETIRIEQDGPSLFATKVTGDENVPAGKPTFRGRLAGTSGTGSGHVADRGYQNPRWIPGGLAIIREDEIEFEWSGVGSVRLRRLKE